MTYDGDFESYSDGAGAHQQGLESRHLVEIHPIRVEQRRWRRFSTIAYEITCSCNWWELDAVVIGIDPDGTFVYEVRPPVAIDDYRRIDIDVMPARSRLVLQFLDGES